MTDTEIKANLYMLERRINQLEQKMKHTADIGAVIEVEQHLYGNIYESKRVVIKGVEKAHEST